MWKRLFYYLKLIDLVWIECSGKPYLRAVYYDDDGREYVYGICGRSFDPSQCNELLEDGRTVGKVNYIDRWYPFNQKPKQKIPPSDSFKLVRSWF